MRRARGRPRARQLADWFGEYLVEARATDAWCACRVLDVSFDGAGLELLGVPASDDEAVRKRLAVYHAQTEPLIAYYSQWAATGDPRAPKYAKVSGVGSVEAVRDACLVALRS